MRESIIAQASAFKTRTGRFPIATDWNRKNGFTCGNGRILSEFGSWSQLRIACGEPVFEARILSDEQMRESVQREARAVVNRGRIWTRTAQKPIP